MTTQPKVFTPLTYKGIPVVTYLFGAVSVLCVVDWLLTMIALYHGAYELNPFFRLVSSFGLGISWTVTLGKVIQISLFWILWRVAKNANDQREWTIGFGLVVLMYLWVSYHNTSVILGLKYAVQMFSSVNS